MQSIENQPLSNKHLNLSGCPNLGIQDDPDTRFSHPSFENLCHKVIPAARVDLGHQRLICWGREYSQCPVYSQEWKGALPTGIRIEADPAHSSSPIRPWMWFAIVGVIGLILVGFFTKPQLIPFWDIHLSEEARGLDEMLIKLTATENPLVNTLTSTPTPAFLITPSPIAQLIPTHSPTETAIDLLMKTLAVTITPYSSKPTLGPSLMTPFGPNSEYIFHQVQTGENLPHLAASYQTSTDAIITVNGLEPNQPLQPGQFIIITWRVEDLEIFPVSILSLEADTMITDIAAQYEISVDDLRYYNELGSSEFIPAGRLIIIPPKVNPNKFSTEPFGPNHEYILHKVKPGDSFPILEALYQTSADVIRKLNSISGILLVDMVVVIVVGETDPSDVQPFKMVFVDVETPINDLAINYRTTEFDLIYYNDLEAGKLVPAGRWLIYPTAK
jgi:LysM repeat protein